MKYWVLTLVVIAACAGILTVVIQRRVFPEFLASANREMVADIDAALTQLRQEKGAWPDFNNPQTLSEQVFVVRGADDRRIEGGYLHGRPSRMVQGVFYDVYDRPLKLTIEQDQLTVASAGANGQWGDGDDVSSTTEKERYEPSTLERARAEAEARVKKRREK